MRLEIKAEVESIVPFDKKERITKADVLEWIDSGEELCRIAKPDTPPKHLVSYFVLVDGDYLLLVDHKNAQLWLPTGGHVEPDEHPRSAALREAKEELNLDCKFLQNEPVLVTSTKTVGKTAGHQDVSLWYVFAGNKETPIDFDYSEFHDAKWFHKSEVPIDRTDPEMGRFLQKFFETNI